MHRIHEIEREQRRRFLKTMAGGGVALAAGATLLPGLFGRARAGGVAAGTSAAAHDVTVQAFADSGKALGPRTIRTLALTDAQWRAKLSDAAFEVMRRDGTERAFSGPHEKPAQPGLYRCPGCATALFDAATQYDSGTGWPSFWQPIAKQNVIESHDGAFGWDRTAVSCAGCNSHLGHVFDDGPRPTGLRYCMNAVSLKFVPRVA